MSYSHLTEQERYVIRHLRSTFNLRERARRLKRQHATNKPGVATGNNRVS
jgi:IS30 family transposase